MSQQGERRAGHEDDWWRQLYDETSPDTDPTPTPDTVDDRFTSAADTLHPTDAGSPAAGDAAAGTESVPPPRHPGMPGRAPWE
ncbi:hypothetical protein GUY61_33530, partial [Streptomyces sp. GC420]|nr:hypothetical protein [Streptomyces sp. GC420]